MLKHLMVLSDGTEIFSGPYEINAIENVKLTHRVNTGKGLRLGCVFAAVAEISLFAPAEGLYITPDTDFTLYQVTEDGIRQKIGLFTIHRVTHSSVHRYRIIAYDRIARLNKYIAWWLKTLTDWPYYLPELLEKICDFCDLTLKENPIPNSWWLVERPPLDRLTAKQLMEWICQISGRFCRATPDGQIELSWYAPRDIAITPSGSCYTFLDSLQADDFPAPAIDKVELWSLDVGSYGTYGQGANSYHLYDTPVVDNHSDEELAMAAEELYNVLHPIRYTPCKLTVPATAGIAAGDILLVTDVNGRTFQTYIMSRIRNGQRDTLECIGK